MGKDDARHEADGVQKMTDEVIETIDKTLEEKEAEIMQV